MVKSLSGHVHKDIRTGFVYGQIRAKSENSPQRYKAQYRKRGVREWSAIIKWRRDFGYTYNQIAQSFDRSTNYVYKVIRREMNRGLMRYQNFNFVPYKTKMICSCQRVKRAIFWSLVWALSGFIEGEAERPP